MNQYFVIARLLYELFPVAIGLVKTLEAELPLPGKGAEKLATIRQFLEGTFTAAGAVGTTFDQIWPALQTLIANYVAMMNAAGVFRHGATPEPAAPANP